MKAMNPHRAQETAEGWLEALSAGDLAAYLDTFDVNGGRSSGPLAGEGLAGQASLKSLFQNLQSQLGKTRYRADHFFTLGTQGLLVWTCDAETQAGAPITFQGITVFEFSPTAKILSLEVFWDALYVLALRSGREAQQVPPPALSRSFLEALNGSSFAQVGRVFSPNAEMEGALSAGVLRGGPVVTQHMIHARRQLGEPVFELMAAYSHDRDVALLWRSTGPDGTRMGGAVLRSADGVRIDRTQMLWSPPGPKH
jgi:hypothetical protein